MGNHGYAILAYSTINLGDEIQSIAARRFLPRVDAIIDRDALDQSPGADYASYKVILNGWFTHHPEHWPPHPAITPLITSFHLSDVPIIDDGRAIIPSEVLTSGAALDYLKQWSPIGARDIKTRDLLEAKGVPSFLSGCLTLTLQSPAQSSREDYLCANDLDDEVVDYLRQATRLPIIRTSHDDLDGGSFAERAPRAEKLLAIYARAKCVVTTRLHAALPCLAYRTPVLLVPTAYDPGRFSGIPELVRICSRDELVSGTAGFDFEEPTPNSDRYLHYRDGLVAQVRGFIGDEAS